MSGRVLRYLAYCIASVQLVGGLWSADCAICHYIDHTPRSKRTISDSLQVYIRGFFDVYPRMYRAALAMHRDNNRE